MVDVVGVALAPMMAREACWTLGVGEAFFLMAGLERVFLLRSLPCPRRLVLPLVALLAAILDCLFRRRNSDKWTRFQRIGLVFRCAQSNGGIQILA